MPKLIIEIDRNGALFFILNAFRGAYDRRTDAITGTAALKEDADLDILDKAINSADADITKKDGK